MARNKGSQELFDLIHSLTPEEKGYYKKFSKRHIPNGSNYLKLFDAIAAQEEFEEASLRARFKNYTVMKVYLKDFITDGLLIYFKNKHPHVNLFSQIQKVHILLIKGQHSEAVRILKKALIQCRKLEVYPIERYLLRVLAEINHHQLTHPDAIRDFYKQYEKQLQENLLLENDLSGWELRNTEWFAKVRGLDVFDKNKATIDVGTIQAIPALTTRSQIKKQNCLYYLQYLRMDRKQKYEAGKTQLQLSEHFKATGDSSFNNIYIQNNYITCCLDLNMFAEAISLSDKMLNSEKQSGFYSHLAFPKSVLFKLDAYFHTAKFKEGLDLVNAVDKKMHQISTSLGDFSAWKEFSFFKHTFLFTNQKYRECWIDMQSVNLKSLQKNYVSDYADYSMLALMLQYEMGNYSTLKNMSSKTSIAFKKLLIEDDTYLSLLSFFKGINPVSPGAHALKTYTELNAYYKKNRLAARKCFGLIDYTMWLKAIGEEKYLKDLLPATA